VLDELRVGTWLAIRRDDDHWMRIKLAWRSEDGEELVFVDRFGRRGFELTRPDLAALFQQDLAEVIGDGRTPIVDRAIDAVRQSLSL
jgi:hypothetical protein